MLIEIVANDKVLTIKTVKMIPKIQDTE